MNIYNTMVSTVEGAIAMIALYEGAIPYHITDCGERVVLDENNDLVEEYGYDDGPRYEPREMTAKQAARTAEEDSLLDEPPTARSHTRASDVRTLRRERAILSQQIAAAEAWERNECTCTDCTAAY